MFPCVAPMSGACGFLKALLIPLQVSLALGRDSLNCSDMQLNMLFFLDRFPGDLTTEATDKVGSLRMRVSSASP